MERVSSGRAEELSTHRASKGGHARAAALSPEERSESARRAVNARWAKERSAAPTASIRVSVPGQAATDEATYVHPAEPLITTEVRSWSVNSHSSVIMVRSR